MKNFLRSDDIAEAGTSSVDDALPLSHKDESSEAVVIVSDTDDEDLDEGIKELRRCDKKVVHDYISKLINNKPELEAELKKQIAIKEQQPNLQYQVIASNHFDPEFDFVSDMTSQFYVAKCNCKNKCIDCMSRKNRIECHPKSCKSKASCTNNAITKCRSASTYIKAAGDKGLGLFAGEDIPKETFICEYAGEIIKRSEMIKRV